MFTVSESSVRASADSEEREMRAGVLQDVMKVVVGPLQKGKLRKFLEETFELVQWECVPLLTPSCFDIAGPKKMSVVSQGTAEKRPYSRGMVSEEDISCIKMADERSVRAIKLI